MAATMLGFDEVRAAATRIAGVVHRTPVLTSRTLDARTGGSVFLKAECFQRGGSFKLRGAYNKISSLSRSELEHGIVAFSSGNHAQAVGIAAGLLHTRALVVMPSDAPLAKLDAARGYGAEVEVYDRRRGDREAIAQELSERRGLITVPPYDDPLVMAGQGTVAQELLEDVGSLDVLVVPVGGGGLIAGCATAAKALAPDIRVIGVEPTASDDTKRSLEAGMRVGVEPEQTIVDGLATLIPGERTFEVNRRLVDDVVLVRDEEVVEAMRFVFDRLKCVVEPSGAAAVAALLCGAVETNGLRVGAVISGGNVGWKRFSELVGVAA